MKKVYLIFTLFWAIAPALYSQPGYEAEPIYFKDFSPEWQHIPVDSSRIVPGRDNGSSLLFAINTIRDESLKIKGHYYYNLLKEFEYRDGVKGWFVEKINLDNGEVEKTYSKDLRKNTEQFFYPRFMYFDREGLPCVVSWKVLNKEKWADFGLFGGPVHLAYHHLDEDLVVEDYPPDDDTTAFRYNANFFYDHDWFFDEGEGTVGVVLGQRTRYFVNDSTLHITNGFRRTLVDGSGYVEDTSGLILHRESPDEDRQVFPKYGGCIRLDNGGYLVGVSVAAIDTNAASMEVIQLDRDWQVVRRYDLLPLMGAPLTDDYAPSFFVAHADKDNFTVVNSFKVGDNYDDFANRIKTLDYTGRVLESIDTLSDGQGYYYFFFKTLKHDNRLWFISIHRSGDRWSTDFLRSDGQGHVELVKRLWATDSSMVLVPYQLKMVDDRHLLIQGSIRKRTENSDQKAWPVVLLMDTDKLGLTNGVQNLTEKEQMEYMLYPTLPKNYLHIEFPEKISGRIEITDATGQVASVLHLRHEDRRTIDVSRLPAGSYSVMVRPEEVKTAPFVTKKFVKR